MSRSLPFLAALALAAAAPRAGAQESSLVTREPLALPVATAPAPDAARSAAPQASVAQLAGVAVTRGIAASPADAAFRQARAREVGSAVQQGGSQGTGKLYMIVGGAAFLAGAIIGDDAGSIIMIGGAGLGIYGLYLYMR